jgi:hypothetical protein
MLHPPERLDGVSVVMSVADTASMQEFRIAHADHSPAVSVKLLCETDEKAAERRHGADEAGTVPLIDHACL